MASEVIGVAELSRQLKELADPKSYTKELRADVRTAMLPALRAARRNIAAISPGERDVHKLYTGEYVAAGFAAKNVKVAVFTSKAGTKVTALMGPTRRAFYASQFFELGTSKLPKHEWLTPAFESQKDQALQHIARGLRKRLDRIAAKRYGRLITDAPEVARSSSRLV